jgi:hypothetical protein
MISSMPSGKGRGVAYRCVSDRSHLLRQVGSHDIDTIGQILHVSYLSRRKFVTHLPCTSNTRDHSLPTQSTICTDLSGDTSDFGRETSQTVHHPIDRALEFQDLSKGRNIDLLAQISLCDCGSTGYQLKGYTDQTAEHTLQQRIALE